MFLQYFAKCPKNNKNQTEKQFLLLRLVCLLEGFSDWTIIHECVYGSEFVYNNRINFRRIISVQAHMLTFQTNFTDGHLDNMKAETLMMSDQDIFLSEGELKQEYVKKKKPHFQVVWAVTFQDRLAQQS